LLYRAFIEGKIDEAEKMSKNLVDLNKKVSGRYSVAGVKAAMNITGYVGGVPRKPLHPLNEAQNDELRKTLFESGYMK